MDRPNPSRRNAQIYQEACEWFVEFRLGQPGDTARRAFHAWLKESPSHMGAYLDVSANWSRGSAIDTASRWSREQLIEDAGRDTHDVVDLPASGVPPLSKERGPLSGKSKRAMRPRHLFTLAASVILVTAALAFYAIALRGVYATTIGEQRTLSLNDGSTVRLNSLSKVRVRYSVRERIVDLLQGQALFHVAKDSARPFVVYSGPTRVKAVGTEFDVYRRDTGTTVTVLEGRVAVLGVPEAIDSVGDQRLPAHDKRRASTNLTISASRTEVSAPRADESSILLGAGEQITITPSASRLTPQPNLAGATAWTQGHLVFQGTSLGEVAEEFNRYNLRKLEIRDSNLLNFQIDGIFSSTDPKSLIRFLRERPEMQVIETDTEILITAPSPRKSE
jgi:transmembrane sensor